MRDYTKIRAWQSADDLTVAVYLVTRRFPKEELYGITSQLRRAVSSGPANIVEGASRGSNQDYLRFLYIARASLTEAHYFIHLSHRLGYLSDEIFKDLIAKASESLRILAGLIRTVESQVGRLGRTSARMVSTVILLAAGILASGAKPFL